MTDYEGFDAWQTQVPRQITRSQLWKFITYRKALYLSDLAWQDCETLLSDERGKSIAWQLIRSSGSIAANIEEGYGRGYGKDYARFLRISLGSARETQGWYYRGRHLWPDDLVRRRLELLDEIISGLVTTSNQQRHR